MLSEENIAILFDVRRGIIQRHALLQLEMDALEEVHHLEEQIDACEYAKWAGRRMAQIMDLRPWELRAARKWYERKLLRGYLVRKECLTVAYESALASAERLKNEEN